MTDLVERIASRIHDAPLPTEYLLDEAGAEIVRLRKALMEINAEVLPELCASELELIVWWGRQVDRLQRIAREALTSTDGNTP